MARADRFFFPFLALVTFPSTPSLVTDEAASPTEEDVVRQPAGSRWSPGAFALIFFCLSALGVLPRSFSCLSRFALLLLAGALPLSLMAALAALSACRFNSVSKRLCSAATSSLVDARRLEA